MASHVARGSIRLRPVGFAGSYLSKSESKPKVGYLGSKDPSSATVAFMERGVWRRQHYCSETLSAIHSNRPLVLVDLTGSGLVKIGDDARLASGSYLIAKKWAQAIWQHPTRVDGVRYHSRHDDRRYCSGIFDRARSHLRFGEFGQLS